MEKVENFYFMELIWEDIFFIYLLDENMGRKNEEKKYNFMRLLKILRIYEINFTKNII